MICYDPENASGFTWGAQNHKREVIRGMKLLLDPAQNMPVYLPASGTNNDLKVLGKSALDIAADFIGAIYKHAMTVIEGEIPKEYLDMCQKQFILSVPAVWSDKAKDLTLKVVFHIRIFTTSTDYSI